MSNPEIFSPEADVEQGTIYDRVKNYLFTRFTKEGQLKHQAELARQEKDLYTKKITLWLKISQPIVTCRTDGFTDEDGYNPDSDELALEQELFPSLFNDEGLSATISREDLERNDFSTKTPRIEQLEAELDKIIPTDTLHQYEIRLAELNESKRQEEIRRQRIADFRSIFNRERISPHLEKQSFLASRRRDRLHELTINQFWAEFATDEERQIAKIENILSQPELTTDDQQELTRWIHFHQEFGLETISDRDYYGFFDGHRLYAHHTNFYGPKLDKTDIDKELSDYPACFLEAVTDGYLIGRKTGKERGETVYGSATQEKVVFFDNEQDLLSVPQTGFGSHVVYATPVPDRSFIGVPVTVITPARLLETYSVKEPHYRSGQRVGIAEGYAFGSANPDPHNTAHELPMSLFVAIMPDEIVTKGRLNRFLESLKITERPDLLPENGAAVRLSEIMPLLLEDIRTQGLPVPRIAFYEPDLTHEEGVKSYIANLGITSENIPAKEISTRKILSTNDGAKTVDPVEMEQIPEWYRINATRLNDLANRVRTRLSA